MAGALNACGSAGKEVEEVCNVSQEKAIFQTILKTSADSDECWKSTVAVVGQPKNFPFATVQSAASSNLLIMH